MEERKGDARVSVISALFFLCIIAGGIFLVLYMLLPEEKVQPWYPFAGMVLVAIPWAFWFFTCVYRCIRPVGATPTGESGRYAKAGSSRAATIPTTSGIATAGNVSDADSPVNSPDGERRVQFAGVVVMGDEDQNGRGGQNGNENNHQSIDMEHHNGINDSVGSTDSEMPLRLMV